MLQVLWDSPGPVSGRDVLVALAATDGAATDGAGAGSAGTDGGAGAGAPRELAITTVLTVLDRLRRKGLVRRERSGRAHLYEAALSREDYVAGLMLEALGQAPDRGAALTRFLGAASPADADHLRRALGD